MCSGIQILGLEWGGGSTVHSPTQDQVESQVQLVGVDPQETGELAQGVLGLQRQWEHSVTPQRPILSQANTQG